MNLTQHMMNKFKFKLYWKWNLSRLLFQDFCQSLHSNVKWITTRVTFFYFSQQHWSDNEKHNFTEKAHLRRDFEANRSIDTSQQRSILIVLYYVFVTKKLWLILCILKKIGKIWLIKVSNGFTRKYLIPY